MPAAVESAFRVTRKTPGRDPSVNVAAFGAAVVLLLCAFVGTTQDNSDFLQFYAGARLLGPELYSVPKAVEIQRRLTPLPQTIEEPHWWMSRPPFEYALFQPFTSLNYQTARRIWFVLIGAAIAGFIWLWPGPRAHTLVYIGFCFPVLQSLRVAQDCMPLMLAVAGVAALQTGGSAFAAGMVASLCMAKPSTLMLVPLSALAFRSKRYAAGLAAGGTLLYGVSAAILHDPYWAAAYVRYTLAVSPHTSTLPLWAVPILAGAVVVWCAGRPPHVVLAVLVCAGLALSPRALYYDLAWGVPLALLLLRTSDAATILLYLYPTIAGFAWYYAGWDGARLVVAALVVCSMALIHRGATRVNV